jgi:hypothetical protein
MSKRTFTRLLGEIEAGLGWLFAYPLIPLQILLFWLIAWGRLGAGLGVDDLFWSESIREQFFNGATCGLLFGELFLVRYLLDPERARFRFRLTLLPVADPAVHRLGQYLVLLWLPALAVLGGFKLFSPGVWGGSVRVQVWPLYLGLATSVGLVSGVVGWASRTRLLARLGGAGHPAGDGSLHGVATLTAGLYVTGLGVIYIRHFLGAELSPVVVACVLLGVANALYGFVAFRLPGFQYVLLILLIGLGLLVHLPAVNPGSAYSLTLPGLEAYYDTPLPLHEGPKGASDERPDHYFSHLRDQAQGGGKPDLIPSEEPLRRMHARWADRHKDGTKPRLVIVCTSGGGIRAAVWTAVVLEGLEREQPAAFRDHIRLFTGASGGMVGAGLYVADFEGPPAGQRPVDPDTGLGGVSGLLARESLRRTAQTMLLNDLPMAFWPGRAGWDRGRELERVWAGRTVGPDGRSPFQKSFLELADLERDGRRPSLVYSPMLVEDSRRLLISNLDLMDLTWTSGHSPGLTSFRQKYQIPAGPDEPLLALSAVELFRLFPDARAGFQVGTAARVNASFPFVSPAVSLPTSPPRRVVDAGYYDNFGVDVAAMWLYRHEAAVREYTSGVLVVEIRAFRNDHARWHFQDTEAEKLTQKRGAVEAAVEGLSAPAEAILTARGRAAYYRNDELLDILNRLFNRQTPGFFASAAFECEVEAALNWTLPREEAKLIGRSFYRNPEAGDGEREMRPWIKTRVEALRAWFGTGGR